MSLDWLWVSLRSTQTRRRCTHWSLLQLGPELFWFRQLPVHLPSPPHPGCPKYAFETQSGECAPTPSRGWCWSSMTLEGAVDQSRFLDQAPETFTPPVVKVEIPLVAARVLGRTTAITIRQPLPATGKIKL